MADRQARIARRKEIEGKLGLKAFELAQGYFSKKTPQGIEEAGEKLGGLLFKTLKKRRERALSNLAMAMPELSVSERESLCREVFRHYGRVTADFLTWGERSNDELLSQITVEGKEHLDAAVAAGKGILVVSAHLGHWERLSFWLSVHGYKLTVVARDVRNSDLNQKVNSLRTRTGTIVLPRGGAARGILEAMRRNEIVAMLPDQSDDEVYVPFFGQPAGTAKGPGVIQVRTGATIVPTVCYYDGPGKYTLRFHPPVEGLDGFDSEATGVTAAVTAKIEEMIRERPEQWLWFHDRWKSARRRGLV